MVGVECKAAQKALDATVKNGDEAGDAAACMLIAVGREMRRRWALGACVAHA